MARVLMLCHDQHLDRRVVAQAQTLIKAGHSVRLLALSYDADTHTEEMPEGIDLTRIGLSDIIPENETYLAYIARQHSFNNILNKLANRYPKHTSLFSKGFTWASKVNWELYKLLLLKRYRNRTLHDPLPFRSAFVKHGEMYKSDLVQVHDLPALEAGVELAGKWNVPLVYDAHELYPEQKSFSGKQRRICSDTEARLIKKANLVFAVNESIGEEMASRYAIEKPLTLLNAIDPVPEFDGQASYDLLREKLNLAQDRKILLFQGGFSPFRNLEFLIEAMAYVKNKDVALVMMGFGTYGELLKAKAERLKLLDSNVYFMAAVPQVELLQHSASADVGIIPYPHVDLNSYFCTPNKLFEFIQAGLPILANDSPELNRFVQGNSFGMTHKMDKPKDIAMAIDAAFLSPELNAWKKSLIEKRSLLTWKSQESVYGDSVEELLPVASKVLETNLQLGVV
ncbi:glycosyltransferase [Pseudomonas putida]|uniref:glycosyltransferase n=1 Tax=Pseudomonas putida TaxID=303 RepID=UPI003D958661